MCGAPEGCSFHVQIHHNKLSHIGGEPETEKGQERISLPC